MENYEGVKSMDEFSNVCKTSVKCCEKTMNYSDFTFELE